MSASSREPSVTRPPWISFLFEPVYTALEQATARVRDLEGEIRRLDPEALRRFQEGVTPENGRKLGSKTGGGELWSELPARSEEVSASAAVASSDQTHPEDAAWLRSEQARLSGLTERELTEITATLEARLGPETADAIIGGASLSELGLEADADLERLVERLRGYAGEGEG